MRWTRWNGASARATACSGPGLPFRRSTHTTRAALGACQSGSCSLMIDRLLIHTHTDKRTSKTEDCNTSLVEKEKGERGGDLSQCTLLSRPRRGQGACGSFPLERRNSRACTCPLLKQLYALQAAAAAQRHPSSRSGKTRGGKRKQTCLQHAFVAQRRR